MYDKFAQWTYSGSDPERSLTKALQHRDSSRIQITALTRTQRPGEPGLMSR
jgi:hypothetical protein